MIVMWYIQQESLHHCSKFTIRYMMLMKLDGHTPYEMLYCVKLTYVHLAHCVPLSN
jgi:hypothetical protein